MDAATAMTRNVRLYPWYALLANAHFWMPVFVLYFLAHMSLADVLRLEAIYYLAVVVLEVPSGYFSDRVGRKPTLLIACASLAVAHALFFIGGSAGATAGASVGGPFAVFAVAQVALAAGIAFNSGTDTSLHYDSLASIDRQAEYDGLEAVAARNGLLAAGISGLIGGAAAMLDLRLAYALSAIGALLALGLVLGMREPASHERMLIRNGMGQQLRACASRLRSPLLRWTFAYAVIMTVLNHVPYEFYQPYIDQVLPEGLRPSTPLAAGLHVLGVMAVASAVASRSIALRERWGYERVLLLGALLQVVIIAAMGMMRHYAVVVLLLARSVPRGLVAAPVNAAIAPRVPAHLRATYLSMQSLAGRLAFAIGLLGLSTLGDAEEQATWPSMSQKLAVAAAVGAAAWLVLLVLQPRKADRHGGPGAA